MSNRTLIALTVVAVLLAVILAVPEDSRTDSGPVFEGWEAAPDSIYLESEEARLTVRRLNDGGWSVDGRPLGDDATRTVDALTHGLRDLRRGAVVRRGVPTDRLVDYGLAQPRSAAGGWVDGREVRLVLGDDSPLGGSVYACMDPSTKGTHDIFVLPSGVRRLVRDAANRIRSSANETR